MTKWAATALLVLAGCGGNGGGGFGGNTGGGGSYPECTSPTTASLDDPNAVALTVDKGPSGGPGYTNGVFVSVTLCVPGTTTCQTIDHLLVDTGSMGVRVLESLLKIPLPAETNDTGLPLAECTPFVDGTAWGPVKRADVYVGGEAAANIPIQAVGDELTFTKVPASCTGTPINNLNDLGSNGIIGVGVYKQDCGTACARAGQNAGLYYGCSDATTCAPTAVPVDRQVPNPVAMFPVDNNGVILQLPCLPPGGAPSAPGVMVFGIGTQANNGLGTAKALPLDKRGFVTTAFPEGGPGYTSFLDSGSNALFFLDTSTTGIKQCTTKGLTEFYCPSSTASLTATISSAAESVPILFNVANTQVLARSPNYAFADIAGPMPGFPTDTSIPGFDWGLPFFFGRSIYTAIEGQATPVGVGPYFAF
jgi:hypothetical protein